MNAVQIIQNLCVKLRQLLVQTDDPVSLALAAFFLVRTAAAILALKIFLGSAVFIAPYRPAVNEMEFLSVRADWQTTFIDREIYRSVWIIAIFLVLAFFFIHGKFNEIVYRHVAWRRIILQQSHISYVSLAVFFDLSYRRISVLHERKQYYFQQSFLIISRTAWPALLNRQVFIQVNMIHHFTVTIYRV